MGLSDWTRKLLDAGYVKPVCTTCLVTGLGWLLHEIYATANTLKTVAQVRPRRRTLKYIHIDGKVTKGMIVSREGHLDQHLGLHRANAWFQRTRHQVAWRLLDMAQSADLPWRLEAVLRLAALRYLSESDLVQLAQACDAHTAVALARCRQTPPSLFLPPPAHYKTRHHKGLIEEVRDILYRLNQGSGHLCVKYFLNKAFPDYEKQSNYLLDAEVMLTEPWTILTSEDNLLPLCVQALDHHISTVSKERELVRLGGLPLLMAIYQELKDNADITKMMCRIITQVCKHAEYLPQIFASGWVGVLAGWLRSNDLQLSLLAGQCLANLDYDEGMKAKYGQNVMPLHPTHRSRAPSPSIDVVFVHGLLGGVISTWRQGGKENHALILGLQKEYSVPNVTKPRHSSDWNTQEYLQTMNELSKAEWDRLGSDFEFVVNDFPVNCESLCTCDGYTLQGSDVNVRKHANDYSYSQCWPKDWLPKDCTYVRVLGIDYESSLSEWFSKCSERFRGKTLSTRSAMVLEQLQKSRIGQRPIVWVAHSMGGLLVKKILAEALSSSDYRSRQIAYNSKAVVFLSTPHLGCPLATMNDILNYLLWPSAEVEELKHNSDVLNHIHEGFLNFLKEVEVKIVTFAEAKSTRISNLGVDIHVVPPKFSFFEEGDSFEMPCDHACVAKPYNRLSFIYQTVLRLIQDVHEDSIKSECILTGK